MELQTVSIFKNWVELAADLPTDAERGKFYHAVCTYSLTGELPELDGILRHYFLLIKPILDTSNRRKLAQIKSVKKRQNAENTSETNSQNDLQSDLQNDLQTDLQTDLQSDLQSDSQNDLQTDSQNDLQNDLQSDSQNDLLGIRVRVREEEKESKEKVKKLFPTFVELLPEKSTPAKKKNPVKSFSAMLPDHLQCSDVDVKWKEWENYRRKKGKPISEAAARKQMKMLQDLSREEAIAAIDNSIANDYQGLFPPKKKDAAAPPPRKDYTGI